MGSVLVAFGISGVNLLGRVDFEHRILEFVCVDDGGLVDNAIHIRADDKVSRGVRTSSEDNNWVRWGDFV